MKAKAKEAGSVFVFILVFPQNNRNVEIFLLVNEMSVQHVRTRFPIRLIFSFTTRAFISKTRHRVPSWWWVSVHLIDIKRRMTPKIFDTAINPETKIELDVLRSRVLLFIPLKVLRAKERSARVCCMFWGHVWQSMNIFLFLFKSVWPPVISILVNTKSFFFVRIKQSFAGAENRIE